jgi:excisionase family DNA binding protein
MNPRSRIEPNSELADARVRPADEVLSPMEVAQELRCSKAHVYKLIHGKVDGVSLLPAVTLGRRRIIRRSSLEFWKRINESGASLGLIETVAGAAEDA